MFVTWNKEQQFLYVLNLKQFYFFSLELMTAVLENPEKLTKGLK